MGPAIRGDRREATVRCTGPTLAWQLMVTELAQPALMTTSATPAEPVTVGRHVHCRQCGYDLFGLTRDGRCPECGMAVVASIGTKLLGLDGPTLVRLRSGAGWLTAATFLPVACLFAAILAPGFGPWPFVACCIAGTLVYARATVLLCSTVADGSTLNRLRFHECLSAAGLVVLATIPMLLQAVAPSGLITIWSLGFTLLAVSGPRRLALLGEVLYEIAASAGEGELAVQLDECGQFGGIAVALACGAAAAMIPVAAWSATGILALAIVVGIPAALAIVLGWAQSLATRARLWMLLRTIGAE